MIKKLSSVLGLASLVVVGTPAVCFSDSLPGTAAQATGSQVTCLQHSHTSSFVTNVCGSSIFVNVPFLSRSTGSKQFFATASFGASCDAILRDFADNFQTSTNPHSTNGRTALGSRTVASNTTINFECSLPNNATLFSVDII